MNASKPRAKPRLWRGLVKRGGLALALLFVVFLAVVVVDGWSAFGKAPSGERLVVMQASPWWIDGAFENPQPLWTDNWGAFGQITKTSEYFGPRAPISVVRVKPKLFNKPPKSGLRVTWLGHSTLLLEIDGYRIVTDPVWGPRTSPLTWLGPKRWYEPPLALRDLPPLDAVILSHDHYDHLDYPTIVALKNLKTKFVAPLGVGAHLEYWGVPPNRIIELDWWDERRIGDLRLVCVPARHASGRTLFDQNRTQWAGFALMGRKHRVLFSGDTGFFPGMAEIGKRFGPFDLTMLEVGAYDQLWPDWHLGPEQAVRAHKLMNGKVLLPVHWGLFRLANHGWTEPIERVVVAAKKAGVPLIVPRPGGSFEPSKPPKLVPWWPQIPWRRAEAYPIVATKNGDPSQRMSPE